MNELDLMSVARECRRIFDECYVKDPNLFGMSVLDLVADNITRVPLNTLKDAIIVSGIESKCNARLCAQMAKYRHTGE